VLFNFARQELVRRDAFDFENEDSVNYRSLLERLVRELVKDEEKQTVEKNNKIEEEKRKERELAKQIRDEKKREAIEKSKKRQMDPNYFQKISQANVKPEPVESTASSEQVQDEVILENEVVNEEDPFRISNKQRNKIFVK